MTRLGPTSVGSACGAVLALMSVGALAQDVAAHLGSFKTESESRAAWTRARSQHGPLLGNREARFVETDVPGRGVWVRVLVPVADRNDANRLCQALKAENQYCVPMVGALGASASRPMPAPSPPPAPAAQPSPPPPPPPPAMAQPAPAPAPARIAAAPPAAVAAAPRPATAAPEPVVAPVLPPVEPPTPSTAQAYFGTWSRNSEDCHIRGITLAASRVIVHAPRNDHAMTCKIDLARGQLTLACEDDSLALFDAKDASEMTLRWTKAGPDEVSIASGAVWRRCPEPRR